MIQESQNTLRLCGQITGPIQFSHESHGERFSIFPICTQRLSEVRDFVNVLARESVVEQLRLCQGDFIQLSGELRSFNNKTGTGTRLVITAYAKELEKVPDGNQNDLTLIGVVCKQPIYRKTPLGREICDLMLAINRRYGRADYLPCIVWGKNAFVCSELRVGCKVHITGRVQSREYVKMIDGIEHTKTTYEVSVSSIETMADSAEKEGSACGEL